MTEQGSGRQRPSGRMKSSERRRLAGETTEELIPFRSHLTHGLTEELEMERTKKQDRRRVVLLGKFFRSRFDPLRDAKNDTWRTTIRNIIHTERKNKVPEEQKATRIEEKLKPIRRLTHIMASRNIGEFLTTAPKEREKRRHREAIGLLSEFALNTHKMWSGKLKEADPRGDHAFRALVTHLACIAAARVHHNTRFDHKMRPLTRLSNNEVDGLFERHLEHSAGTPVQRLLKKALDRNRRGLA